MKSIFWIVGLIISPIIAILAFVGINVPLIIFDCLLKLINVVSGSALFNQLIKGVHKFNPNDPIFIVYMIMVGISLFLIIFSIVKVAAKQSFNPSNQNAKTTLSRKLIWILYWMIGIFIVPIIFSATTLLISVISSIFSYNSLTITPLEKNIIINALNEYQLNFNKLIDSNNSLMQFLNDNKLLINNSVNVDELLKDLNYQNNYLNAFNKELNSLISSIKITSNNYLTKKEAILINHLTNELNNFVTPNTSDLNYFLISTSDPILVPGVSILNNFLNSQNLLTNIFAKGVLVDSVFIKLDHIYYSNSGEHFIGWRAEKLTLQIISSIYDTQITNLFNIPFKEIGTLFLNDSGSATTIFRIIFGCLLSVGLFFLMLNILLKLAKRTFELLYLMMLSPLAIANGISDNGEKCDLWLKTTTGKMIVVFFSSICFQLLQIIIIPIFDWSNNINFYNNEFVDSILSFILSMIVFFASLISIREIIEQVATSLGDSSRLNNAGGTTRNLVKQSAQSLLKKSNPAVAAASTASTVAKSVLA